MRTGGIKRRNAVSRISTAVVIVIIIAVAAAAATYYYTRPATPTSTNNLTVAAIPVDDGVPLYVAQQLGYFAKEGINITIDRVGSGPIELDAIASGAAQIGMIAPTSLVGYVQQGFNYTFIAPSTVANYPTESPLGSYLPPVNGFVSSPNPCVTLTSSGITSLTQLPGKTISVGTISQEVDLNLVLGEIGVNASNVHYTVASNPIQEEVLLEHRADVVCMVQPYMEQLVLNNETGPNAGQFRAIGDDIHYSSSVLIAGWFAKTDWANTHKTLVDGFLTAIHEADAAVSSNRNLVNEYLVNYLKINSTVAAQMPLPIYDGNTTLPYAGIQLTIDAGIRYGLFNAGTVASDLVNSNFLTLST